VWVFVILYILQVFLAPYALIRRVRRLEDVYLLEVIFFVMIGLLPFVGAAVVALSLLLDSPAFTKPLIKKYETEYDVKPKIKKI